MRTTPAPGRWLLLIHHIPPRPAYLRVKVGRRLQQLGALPIKNSVYALPRSDGAQEDFEWVAREVRKGGGDATVCEARFVDGLGDADVERLFVAARNADYRDLAASLRSLSRQDVEAALRRARRRLDELSAVDYFGAPGRQAAESAIRAAEARLGPRPTPKARPPAPLRRRDYRARTWVTRRGIYVDRMACAWLIRRFIDPRARFSFVAAKGYAPARGELRFDMFEGEFTHEGDLCSFETLLARFEIDDAALRAVGEIVHDIDLKDGKFRREEAPGLDRVLAGIAMSARGDRTRLARSSAVLDDLYACFRRKPR